MHLGRILFIRVEGVLGQSELWYTVKWRKHVILKCNLTSASHARRMDFASKVMTSNFSNLSRAVVLLAAPSEPWPMSGSGRPHLCDWWLLVEHIKGLKLTRVWHTQRVHASLMTSLTISMCISVPFLEYAEITGLGMKKSRTHGCLDSLSALMRLTAKLLKSAAYRGKAPLSGISAKNV